MEEENYLKLILNLLSIVDYNPTKNGNLFNKLLKILQIVVSLIFFWLVVAYLFVNFEIMTIKIFSDFLESFVSAVMVRKCF